jgi:hypothetical protein
MKIDLTAKDKTGNAFRSLNARLEKTRKVAKSVVGVVAKVGAAAVALGAGLVVATKKALEFADGIAKTADKVGLSTDALQKYRYAADLAGVSNGDLDKAFDKLNKSIGETINDGTGAAFDAFTQLGLQADLASGKLRGTEPVFLAVADAISKVKDQSQRAALLADLFGRSGTKLAVLMKNGSADIKAAAKELDDFGGVIEEGTLRSSEKAIDAITRLTTLMQSKLTKALADNAPLIADFGKDLLENLPKIIGQLKSVLRFLGLIGKEARNKTLVELIDEQIKRQKVLDKLLEKQAKGYKVDLTKAQEQLDLVTEAIEKIERLKGASDISPRPADPPKPRDTGKRGGGLGLSPADRKKADEAAKANADFIKLISDPLDKIKTIRAEILKGAQDTAAAAKFELEYANASESVRNRALAVIQIENKLKAEGITLSDVQREQLEAALDLTQQRQETLQKIKLNEEARIEAAEKLKETQRQANDLIKTGLQSMQDGLTGLIDGTQTWKQALGGVLRTVINIAAKMGETSTGGFSFGKLASGLASLFSGTNPNNFQSGFNSAGQMVDFFHTGGKIGGRNGQMAGLRSDERMIIGQTGERVLSRGQAAQGDSGGVVVNQTINLSTGVQQTVRAEVMSLAPQIAAQAKAAVLDAKKRGGGFGAAFA